MNSKGKFIKRVSLLLTLSFVVSNFTFKPIKTMAVSANNTPYTVDSSNYDKPNSHQEQSILADVYKDTPGYQPSDKNIPKGWSFYETELFPKNFVDGTDYKYGRYNGSPTAESYMNKAHYWIDTSNVEGTNYYDNWRFSDLYNKVNVYNYGPLIYYQQLPVTSQSLVKILGDTCNIEYQIDTNTFDQGPNNGTTAYNKMPDYTSLNAGDEYVADYHISGVTANPVAIAPTADFYFNNGSTSTTVQAGDTLKVIDGKGFESGTTYTDKNTKYWSTYYDTSGGIHKHNNDSTLPQSYTYNNAIITGSSWSVCNSSGQNVNDLFKASDGLTNKSLTGAASEMDLTVSSEIPAGTYTVNHKVIDNWGTPSEDHTRTFTVSDIKQNYLAVHYIDKDSGADIQDLDKQTSPYSPQAPSGYILTGNYRINPNGNDSIFNYNNGTEISVDLSASDKEIYVMCKKSEGKGTVVKRYFVDGLERTSDEEKITDVPVGSHTYSADKDYSGYTCSNSSVTVDVKANDTVYADFTYTVIPVPTEEKGTVIKRYFLKGVEQTNDEEKIEDVSVGPHTYSTYKTYQRYNCENPSVTVNVTANSINYCDFNYGFENHPPTVTLQGPETVVMGDEVNINASGVDPDGDPLTYTWNTPPDLNGSASGYTASGYFDNTGDKTYSVTVTDPYDASGSANKTIKVVPPVPNVVIDKSGNEKENRKVTLNAEKYSSSGSNSGRYPLDWSKEKWQFFDGSGNELAVDSNPTSSTIVKSLQSNTGSKNMDLIFKEAGKYTAKCTLYNTAGYSNSFSVDLNIVPDLAPTADFNFPDGNNGYRDGKDLSPNGLAQGTDKLVDSSSSRDNDNIGKRMWLACFDSDNDGSFIDITNNEDGTKKAVPEKERWYVYDLDYNGDSDARYKIQVPDSTPLNGKLVTIGADGRKYAYINDSLNPHWRYVGSYDDVKKLDINKINCGNLTSVNFKSTSCGHFYYAEEIEESFGQETIPELITDKDKKQANTFEF